MVPIGPSEGGDAVHLPQCYTTDPTYADFVCLTQTLCTPDSCRGMSFKASVVYNKCAGVLRCRLRRQFIAYQ
jgi:hypothetical protein